MRQLVPPPQAGWFLMIGVRWYWCCCLCVSGCCQGHSSSLLITAQGEEGNYVRAMHSNPYMWMGQNGSSW
jgi:hypothetical protein